MFKSAILSFTLLFGVAATTSTTTLLAAEPVRARVGSLFNPADFTSLGKLAAGAGDTVTFDTGSGTVMPTVSGKLTATGVLGVSASGKSTYAVFTFDSVDLIDKSTIIVTGKRPLVLISKAALSVGTILSVNGADGTSAANGAEAVGAIAAAAVKPGNGAQGGSGGTGSGLGGGCSPTGAATALSTRVDDPALAEVSGGIGGSAGIDGQGKLVAGGGAGGGALILISAEKVFIAGGRVSANGGKGAGGSVGGGGGAGGSILLAAPAIWFRYGGTAEVTGGAGASGGPGVAAEIANKVAVHKVGSGGGGGGGRIAYYLTEDIGAKGKDQIETPPLGYFPGDIDGGNGGIAAGDGKKGTVYDGMWPTFK